jgi:hyperosmotically inducible protein
MTLRLITAALAAATLVGVAGCDRDADRATSSRPVTTPPQSTAPSPATPPASTAPAPGPVATTPPATDRTMGEAAGDAAVTAKVKAALLAEKNVDGLKINVDTRDGKVTLTGNVPEPAQVERATQVARGIEGVKTVDNQLRAGAS